MSTDRFAPPQRRELGWLVVLLVVVVVVRVIALGADPLPDTESGFITDWGDWSRNARLHALRGVWMVDDFNNGLVGAFGFTMAVRVVFALLGVGQAQTNLVNVVSGIVAVLTIYALVRAFAPAKTALVAAALMGINPMTIAYDRAGYPESFQLMLMILAVAGTLSARKWIAGLGGLCFALAIMAKWTGLVLVPITGAIWVAQWYGGRFLGLSPRFSWSRVLVYGTVAGLGLLIYGLAFVLPHQADIGLQLAQSSVGAFEPVARGARPDRVSLFGFTTLGYRMNGFFGMQWYLVILAACFAAGRIARILKTPLTQLELACWVWLGLGGLYLARIFYQPDRRFMFLVPPLVVLSALFLGREIVVGPSAWAPRVRRIAFAVAGALVGGFLTFHGARFYGPYRVMSIAERLSHPLSFSSAAGLLVTSAVVVFALGAAALSDPFRRTRTLRRQWVLVPLICGIVTARWAYQIAHRSYSIRRVEAAVGRLTESWPDSERIAAGGAASTLSVGTRVLGVSYQLKGPSSIERFHPPLAILLERPNRPFDSVLQSGLAGPPVKVDCAQFPLWPTGDGTPQFTAHLLVEPSRLEECRKAVSETDPALRAGRGS